MGKRTNLCLALSLSLLAACSSTTQAAKQTPTPSAAVKPVVGRIVEPPPTSCPAGPNPQTVSPDFGPGLGQAPVWAVTFSSGAHGAILLIQG